MFSLKIYILVYSPDCKNQMSLQFVSGDVAKQHKVTSRHYTGMVKFESFV